MTLQEYYDQNRLYRDQRLEEFLHLRMEWAAKYHPQSPLGHASKMALDEDRKRQFGFIGRVRRAASVILTGADKLL